MPMRRAGKADPHAGELGDHQQGVLADRRGRRSRQPIDLFTVAEVAVHLGVAGRTVRPWIADEQLVVHRLGRAVRISEQDLRVFLADRRGH